MNNLAIIIQARTGSTRLPNKLLLPFSGVKTIFEIIIERIKEYCVLPIIVATTTNINDDVLMKKAIELGVNCYRGSEKDVLNRFIKAAEAFNCKNIIRVCADNPFLNSIELADLITFISKNKCDYAGFLANDKPSITTHFGFWPEFVTLKALKNITTFTSEVLYHEHVTNFIYQHPDRFVIKWIKTSQLVNKRKDIRLTIDTKLDFSTASFIFDKIYSKKNNPSITEIIYSIDENLPYLEKMKEQISKNEK